jgi:hypothetical protein
LLGISDVRLKGTRNTNPTIIEILAKITHYTERRNEGQRKALGLESN